MREHIGNITRWDQRDKIVMAMSSDLHSPGSFTGPNIQKIFGGSADGRPEEWVSPFGLQDQGNEMSSINEQMCFRSDRGLTRLHMLRIARHPRGFCIYSMRIARSKILSARWLTCTPCVEVLDN